MTRAIALDALLHAAQHLRHPRADPRGLQTRLTHRLDDAIAAEQFRRDAAAEAIQRAIIPLVLNGRPRRALVAAADTADQRHDLHPAERLGVIEGEIAWALRTGAIQLRTAHAG